MIGTALYASVRGMSLRLDRAMSTVRQSGQVTVAGFKDRALGTFVPD
jgi:hypothetical protein